MFMNQYCPHITTCPFYEKWEEDAKRKIIYFDKRQNAIVIKEEEEIKHSYYDCLPLIFSNDFEKNPMLRKYRCSHLTLLNLLDKLDKK